MLRKTIKIEREIFSFIYVGVLNTMVGYGLYTFFLYIHLRYFLALLLATCLGVIFNFITIGKIVFRRKKLKQFFKFSFMYIFLYFIGLILINVFHGINLNLYFSGFLSMIFISALSFFGNKFFIFRNKHDEKYNTEKYIG